MFAIPRTWVKTVGRSPSNALTPCATSRPSEIRQILFVEQEDKSFGRASPDRKNPCTRSREHGAPALMARRFDHHRPLRPNWVHTSAGPVIDASEDDLFTYPPLLLAIAEASAPCCPGESGCLPASKVHQRTAAVSNRLPRIHSRMVRYCQLASLPCQRWPPLWVAR